MTDEQQGLYEKFRTVRTDGASAPGGKHHNCDYFVLDTTHDKHAAAALAAYADSVEATHPQLAAEMRARWKLAYGAPIDMVLHCPACGLRLAACSTSMCRKQTSATPSACMNRLGGSLGATSLSGGPTHKSHLCANPWCRHIWRPADVPTNGVADTKTHGKNDSPKGPKP